jgi:hypothetical protein
LPAGFSRGIADFFLKTLCRDIDPIFTGILKFAQTKEKISEENESTTQI